MREDMAKVIVERPRVKCGVPKGYKGRLQRTPLGEEWKRESIKYASRRNAKYLNENLAPLRRFLRSRCGRPWDKVYGEICERINRNSAVQLHIWQHLVEFVHMKTTEVGGEVRDSKGKRLWREFYVHPRTRLLRRNEHYGDWFWRRYGDVKRTPPEPITEVKLDETRICRMIDGVWYEFQMRPVPRDGSIVYDYLLQKLIHPRTLTYETWGGHGGRYAASKRQLNSKEVRRLLSQNG